MLLALSIISMSMSKSSSASTRSSTSADLLLAIAIFSFIVTLSGLPMIKSSISVVSGLCESAGSSAVGGARPTSCCGSSGWNAANVLCDGCWPGAAGLNVSCMPDGLEPEGAEAWAAWPSWAVRGVEFSTAQ